MSLVESRFATPQPIPSAPWSPSSAPLTSAPTGVVCPICYNRDTTMVATVPCGHIICVSCRNQLQGTACALCRGVVESYISVFLNI